MWNAWDFNIIKLISTPCGNNAITIYLLIIVEESFMYKPSLVKSLNDSLIKLLINIDVSFLHNWLFEIHKIIITQI